MDATETSGREAHAILSAVIDSTSDHVFCVSVPGHALIAFNRSFEDYVFKSLGFRIEPGMDVFRCTPTPQHERVWRQFLDRAVKEGPFTTDYQSALGHSMQLHLCPLRSGDRVFGISVFAQDHTGRMKAEETLRQRNEYIEAILQGAPIGFAVRSMKEGTARLVTARYEEILGCPRGAIVSHATFFEVVWPRHPELRESVRARVTADLLSGDPRRMRWEDVPVPRENGEVRYVTVGAIPIPEQDLVVFHAEDTTDRVRAEERLKESELRFRQVAESVTDFIWEVDADGLYTYTSPSVEKILGFSPEELVGKKHFYDLYAPDVRDPLRSSALLLFAARQPFRTFASVCQGRQGRVVYLEASGVPLFDASGELRGYRGADSDVTARKRAEQVLERSFVEVEQQKEKLQAERDYLQRTAGGGHTLGIVGDSRAIQDVLFSVRQVAPTGTSVLITGETGTGKELIAHAIHQLSLRRARTMVIVNCAALPPGLIESELFGHERGAYTGAFSTQTGRFELADGSTLFLDEIAELSVDLQVKLLRVLDEGVFERLGSGRPRHVDVRLIAATNRDLAEEVRRERFRADLYYRLSVFPIHVPPLQERREDIPQLVWRFADYFSQQSGRTIDSIPQETMERLLAQPWPGNVRELRNVIERAVILSRGGTLTVSLPEATALSPDGREPVSLEDVERQHITKVLARTGGRIGGRDGAAALLGLNRTTLQSMLKRLGITRRGNG